MYETGVFRFDFQIAAVGNAQNGIVLNLGCNEDPAGLRMKFGSRVINCDIEAFDQTMNRPNVVDRVFDMTQTPWEFGDDYAAIALFGDVLEHFSFEVIVNVLREAHRVAHEVCITVPEDHRIDQDAKYQPGVYNPHVTVVTYDLLKSALTEAGWTPYLALQAGWGFNDDAGHEVQGHCVMAQRVPESVGSITTEQS